MRHNIPCGLPLTVVNQSKIIHLLSKTAFLCSICDGIYLPQIFRLSVAEDLMGLLWVRWGIVWEGTWGELVNYLLFFYLCLFEIFE